MADPRPTRGATPDGSASAVPRALSPVTERERVVTLDMLRGLAVFGMLLANVKIFGWADGAAAPTGTQPSPGAQLLALFEALLVEGKFYTLFSILFGIGLWVQSARAAARGMRFAPTYMRRCLLLLVLGVAHAVLLYEAEILALYALVALAALPLRRLAPRRLLQAAVVCYAVGALASAGFVAASPEGAPPHPPDWAALAAAPSPRAEAAQRSWSARIVPVQAVGRLAGIPGSALASFMADEQRVFAEGSFGEMVRHRIVLYMGVAMPLRLVFTAWLVLGLFLFGAFLAKSGVFVDGAVDRGRYVRMASVGLSVGLPLQGLAGAMAMAGGRGWLAAGLVLSLAAVPATSLGYAGLVSLWSRGGGRGLLASALAAVGRTALSNYVGQSVVCGLVFYSYGLGLFGRLTGPQLAGVALAVFALEAAASMAWLRVFRLGPLEWAWRSLTYGKRQPLLRGGTA